jgi:sugar phosphate isomerase/epimerase
MEDLIAKAVDLRVDGVDMTVYFLKSTEPAYLANLRHLARKNGMPFSGAACGSSMVEADAAKRAQVVEDIKKWIEVTDRSAHRICVSSRECCHPARRPSRPPAGASKS